jgi:hypothetical protein
MMHRALLPPLLLQLLGCGFFTGAASGSPADHTTCGSCVRAGFGWSLAKGRCGRFANTVCPASSPSLGRQRAAAPTSPPTPTPPSEAQSLRAEIARLKDTNVRLSSELEEAKQAVAAAVPSPPSGTTALCTEGEGGGRGSVATWRPTPRELASFQPQTTPFGWTPIWAASTKGKINMKELRAAVMALRRVAPKSAGEKSNAGGFHSDGDLLGEGRGIDGDARSGVLKDTKDEIFRHIHAYHRAARRSHRQARRAGHPELAENSLRC